LSRNQKSGIKEKSKAFYGHIALPVQIPSVSKYILEYIENPIKPSPSSICACIRPCWSIYRVGQNSGAVDS